MRRFILSCAVVATMVAAASAVQAQVPVVTYYSPSTVYYSSPAVSSYTVSSPVVVSTPAPAVTYYRTPVTTYYPATPTVTRYRPFLGRSVVRYPYSYGPVVYYR
jgi:hypothetical protein